MQLITAKCPDCGADLKITPGGRNVVCEYCGSNILVTDVLGSNAIMQNCMTLAYAAMQGENYEDAYEHFNKALEQNSTNYSAWYGKAICSGMQSHVQKARLDEMLVLFETAFNYAPADKLANLKKSAAAEIVKTVKHQKVKIDAALNLLKQVSKSAKRAFNIGNMGSNAAKGIKEANAALTKALQYDPANNDAIELQQQFTKYEKKSGNPENEIKK
jgi:tetratricopeptide (TPR) repeat protein